MIPLNLIEPSQANGDTTLLPILDCNNKAPPDAIVESQVQNSEMTSIEPSGSCESSTQEQKSSKTFFVPSTISVKGLNPYWNAQCAENSSKLWLPIKIDSPVSDLSLFRSLSNKAVEKSWFSSELIYPQSKSLQTRGDASSMSWNVGCTDSEITKVKSSKPCHPSIQARIDCRWYVFNEAIKYLRSCVNFFPTVAEIKRDLLGSLPAWCNGVPLKIKAGAISEAVKEFKAVEANPMTRAKTIKLKPTAGQRQIFKKWNDCSRYVFNQTIDYIRSCVTFANMGGDIKKDLLKQLPKWCDDVPFLIKGQAVKEAHQAYSSAKGHPKFRSRKNPTQSCYIPKSAIKGTGIYPRVSGKNLSYTEALPEEPLDGRLIYQYNEWFLSVPQKIEKHGVAAKGVWLHLILGFGHSKLFILNLQPGKLVMTILGVLLVFAFILMI
jgi:putative transposase